MYSWQGLPVMGWAEPDAPGRARGPQSSWPSLGVPRSTCPITALLLVDELMSESCF